MTFDVEILYFNSLDTDPSAKGTESQRAFEIQVRA